jgi:hypothetical protein
MRCLMCSIERVNEAAIPKLVEIKDGVWQGISLQSRLQEIFC